MVVVTPDTRMAGIRMGSSWNFLLWHWVRFISSIGCVALALGLTQFSCGGSKKATAPTPSQENPAKPEAAAQDRRPVIVAFGDSLTAGFGAETGASYPDFLQNALERARIPWRGVNAGVSGDTTTDGVNPLSEVLTDKPRIVILQCGRNER